jgi:hypothetical protein
VGDFNGDGRTDFVSAQGNFDTWLGQHDGTFRYTHTPPCGWTANATDCVSGLANHLIVGDFNGDGRTDFVSAQGNFDTWLGQPDGTFAYTHTPTCGWAANATDCVNALPNRVIVGDFNGDGRTDFVSAQGNFDTWLGQADGTFAYTHTPTCGFAANATDCLSSVADHLVIGDFNGDGRVDFMSANGNFDIWLGQMDGTFAY